jgi:hypothetical protein
MTEPSRHVPLRSISLNATAASAAIEEIVADAVARFDADRFWRSQPIEDGTPDGMANLYFDARVPCAEYSLAANSAAPASSSRGSTDPRAARG